MLLKSTNLLFILGTDSIIIKQMKKISVILSVSMILLFSCVNNKKNTYTPPREMTEEEYKAAAERDQRIDENYGVDAAIRWVESNTTGLKSIKVWRAFGQRVNGNACWFEVEGIDYSDNRVRYSIEVYNVNGSYSWGRKINLQ